MTAAKTGKRLLSAALGLTLLSALTLWSASAQADGVQLADNSLAATEFDAPAVALSELDQLRGAGLDAQPVPAPEGTDKFAVILWDEFQTPRDTNSAGQAQGAGGSISFSTRQ